jgi:hypothetical protein
MLLPCHPIHVHDDNLCRKETAILMTLHMFNLGCFIVLRPLCGQEERRMLNRRNCITDSEPGAHLPMKRSFLL